LLNYLSDACGAAKTVGRFHRIPRKFRDIRDYFQSFFAELWLFGHTFQAAGRFRYFLAM
jgi:hypothetical protein